MKISMHFEAKALQTFNGANCLTISKSSIESLLHDRTPHGPAYQSAIVNHAADVATGFFSGVTLPEPKMKIAIVEIPRGGIPCAEGVRVACNALGYKTDILTSRCKTDPNTLYPAKTDWSQYQAVILTDGVIGSGSTIIKHLEQIPKDLQPNTVVFSNVTSELGARNIAESRPAKAVLVTGLLLPEEDCQWMRFDEKSVYFIGYNEARGVDLKLPDFGDAIQPKLGL